MTQPVYPPPPMPAAPPTVHVAGLAVASMVCGIMGWFYAIPAICAVVFGHIALSQIKKSNGWKTGRGMAIAGVVLGYVWIGVWAAIIILAIANSGNAHTTTYN